jgi:hypothetical protein
MSARFESGQRVYHHGRPATVVRMRHHEVEIRYDRHVLAVIVPPGFLATQTATMYCDECEFDTRHALEPVSQGHSRAPRGSEFGWFDCTECQTGQPYLIDANVSLAEASDALGGLRWLLIG